MLKVFYTHDIFTFQPYGGISRYMVEIIKRIPPEEAETKIFAGLHVNRYLKGIPNVTGLKFPEFPRGFGWNFINGVMHLCRKYLNDRLQWRFLNANGSTIIHLSDYTDVDIPEKARVVLTVHDMIFELFPQFYPQHERLTMVKRRCCERADRIIAVSNCTKKDLIQIFNIDSDKVEVIYHGNSLKGTAPDTRAFGFLHPFLLFVGDRRGYKNFDRVVEAFARSKKLSRELFVLCFGGGSFTPREKRLLHRFKLDRVFRHVEGNDALLAACYRKARALIFPSLYEGFGMPLVEAMGFGCPIICSNRGPIPEIVGAAGIYFDPESTDEIVHTLETVLFDDTLLSDLSRKGYGREPMFSWDQAARKTLAVYRAAI